MKGIRGILWSTVFSVVFGVGLLLFFMLKTDTVYSPGFSIRKFYGVSVGESIYTVIERLGEPLSVVDFSEEKNDSTNRVLKQQGESLSEGVYWLRYSRGADGNCDFVCFQIAVSNGIVSSKHGFIYRD